LIGYIIDSPRPDQFEELPLNSPALKVNAGPNLTEFLNQFAEVYPEIRPNPQRKNYLQTLEAFLGKTLWQNLREVQSLDYALELCGRYGKFHPKEISEASGIGSERTLSLFERAGVCNGIPWDVDHSTNVYHTQKFSMIFAALLTAPEIAMLQLGFYRGYKNKTEVQTVKAIRSLEEQRIPATAFNTAGVLNISESAAKKQIDSAKKKIVLHAGLRRSTYSPDDQDSWLNNYVNQVNQEYAGVPYSNAAKVRAMLDILKGLDLNISPALLARALKVSKTTVTRETSANRRKSKA
jgi:hypothetical protein